MIQFFKDSVRELKHVVWPTRAETKAHFIVVLVILILF
ncbi:preprotein translocase subunit SecE [bacterium]|nr:preprotein translocase subunit SecE [bacterium]